MKTKLRSFALVSTLAGLAAMQGMALVGITISGGYFTNAPSYIAPRQSFVPSWYTGTITTNSTATSGTTTNAAYRDSFYTKTTGTVVTYPTLNLSADFACPTNYPVTYSYTNLYAPTNGVFGFVSAGAWSITATTANQTNTFTGTSSYLNLDGVHPEQLRCYYYDQADAIYCCEAYLVGPYLSSFPYLQCQVPSTTQGALYSRTLYGGDSSCPVMMKVGGATVLLCAWHYAIIGSPTTVPFMGGYGPFVSADIAQINSFMTELSTVWSTGSNYQLTQVSLSSFGTF